MKNKTTRYSIQTNYGADYDGTKRTHPLGFYYNPSRGHVVPRHLDATKLSHAKKTLKHCRESWPKWEHKIFKTITITEVLNY